MFTLILEQDEENSSEENSSDAQVDGLPLLGAQSVYPCEMEGWMWKVKVKVMSDSLWPHELYSPWNSLGQNTGIGSLSFLQGIFPS